jgi:hypothetical protein
MARTHLTLKQIGEAKALGVPIAEAREAIAAGLTIAQYASRRNKASNRGVLWRNLDNSA